MKMPWKHRWIVLGIGLLNVIICFHTFDSVALRIKGILFLWVLLMSSYYDIRTRTIPDLVHVMIMLVALINISWMSSILGLILVPLPFFIMACLNDKSFGGGDIKLIGACSFLVGFQSAFIGMIIALSFAIVCQFILKKKDKDISFPFAPYIACGMALIVFKL